MTTKKEFCAADAMMLTWIPGDRREVGPRGRRGLCLDSDAMLKEKTTVIKLETIRNSYEGLNKLHNKHLAIFLSLSSRLGSLLRVLKTVLWSGLQRI